MVRRELRISLILSVLVPVSLISCSKEDEAVVKRTAPPPVQFVDVASQTGLHFEHVTGRAGRYYYVETYGGGGALFDYDDDGDLDVYLCNGADLPGYVSEVPPTNMLYRNEGDGTFVDVTAASGTGHTGYSSGCAVGDYDRDRDLDLFVTNFNGPNTLYRNNGDGTFTDVTETTRVGDIRWSTSTTFLDYDNDGWLDLYVGNYVDFTLENNTVCESFGGIRYYCQPTVYEGIPDILLHNNQDGTFTDVSREAGITAPVPGRALGVACADYDVDGYIDIFVANDETQNFLFHNNQDGTFTDVALYTGSAYFEDGRTGAGMGVDFGDYDNNGHLDILVCNFSFEINQLLRNNTDGTFTDVSYISSIAEPSILPLSFGTALFDYDNDGDQDIFTANGHVMDNVHLFHDNVTFAQKNKLYRNDGPGTFTDVSLQSGVLFQEEKVSRAAIFGDYDNDGDIDILVVNEDAAPTLMRNETASGNNWISIKTIGTESNPNGIGARVKVVAGNLVQVDEVRSGYSYLSANDLRVHFGLAHHQRVDLIEIRWPSGLLQTLQNIPVNRFLTVEEPEG